MPSTCLCAATPESRPAALPLPKFEMCFADGSRLWLRQATADPLQRFFERKGETLYVDLRALAPELEQEFIQAAPHTRPGLIFVTFRRLFTSVDAFIERVDALEAAAREAAR